MPQRPLIVSAIVPNHNNARDLQACLAALAAQADDGLEIVVVDDASTDDSVSIARRYAHQTFVLEKNAGPSAARNRGARESRGEVLWFLDSDIEVHPGALARVRDFFLAHPGADALIGSYDDTPSAPGVVSRFRNLLHHYVHQQSPEIVSTFWSGCGAMRRTAFEAVGGFDEVYFWRPMMEDIHLGYALQRGGYETRIDKALQVTHHKRWTLGLMIRTDIFQRAAPWTVVLLRYKKLGSKELNLDSRYRYSVAAVGTALLALAAAALLALASSPLWLPMLAIAAVTLAVPLALNAELMRFFARRGGAMFTLLCAPLLWVYFFCCGAGFLIGALQYLREGK